VIDPTYAIVGLCVGLLIGWTGIGGGAILTPVLVAVFGQSPSIAVGTDLAFAAVTKLAGVSLPSVRGRIDWPVVGRLAVGSIPGAVLALVALRLTPHLVIDGIVVHTLAVMLLATAAALLLKERVRQWGVRWTAEVVAATHRLQTPVTVAAGLVLGAAVTLTSVGAGALGTTALVFLYPLRLSAPRLVATDIAHAIPLAVLAALGHAALGDVSVPLLASLLVGSIPGILLASRLTLRIPDSVQRGVISVMLVVSAWRLLRI
jgi:uncharacterized membrane protein YfcA